MVIKVSPPCSCSVLFCLLGIIEDGNDTSKGDLRLGEVR